MNTTETPRELALLGVKPVPNDLSAGETSYVIEPPANVKIYERGLDRLLVGSQDADGFSVEWALLEWAYGDTDGKDRHYGILAYGCGLAGSLREARHTYFGAPGDEGYVFYVNPALIAWGFGILREHFDFDGQDS